MAISPGGRPADASPVGTPGGRQNWVDKAGGLPRYVRMVAHALMRKRGLSESQAIQMAIGVLKNWASGRGNVTPKVRAAAAAAIAEWEAKKASTHSHSATNRESVIELAVPAALRANARKTAASKGHAMPGGRYPIRNRAELLKAMRAVGRTPADKRPAVRAFIKKRAKQLGAQGKLGPKYTNLSDSAWDRAIDLAGKWRHGWIPLDAVAAAIKAHRSAGGSGVGLSARPIQVSSGRYQASHLPDEVRVNTLIYRRNKRGTYDAINVRGNRMRGEMAGISHADLRHDVEIYRKAKPADLRNATTFQGPSGDTRVRAGRSEFFRTPAGWREYKQHSKYSNQYVNHSVLPETSKVLEQIAVHKQMTTYHPLHGHDLGHGYKAHQVEPNGGVLDVKYGRQTIGSFQPRDNQIALMRDMHRTKVQHMSQTRASHDLELRNARRDLNHYEIAYNKFHSSMARAVNNRSTKYARWTGNNAAKWTATPTATLRAALQEPDSVLSADTKKLIRGILRKRGAL